MKNVETTAAPQAIGPYAQGKIIGNLLFASGQIPLHPETGEIVGTEIKEQTKQVMENIKGILSSEQLTFDHIIKTTCFLSDMNDFAAFNEIYGSYFSKGKVPARSCVEVARLPKDVCVEVEFIATLNG